MINDLIEDLTRMETRDKERIPLTNLMNRVHNNNKERNILTKQSSLLSSGSRGSAPESVIIDTRTERVSSF